MRKLGGGEVGTAFRFGLRIEQGSVPVRGAAKLPFALFFGEYREGFST
jgi:hypothetical protein